MSSIKLSYAIPVCNEHDELKQLLDILVEHKEPQDEIVVMVDANNTTDAVFDVISSFDGKVLKVSHALNGDFATHKNYLNSKCSGDWIFQLDADEFVSETLLVNIHNILESNDSVEAIWVPRINTVDGLTASDIAKWNWNISPEGWVNFPDFQCRLYKNKEHIIWHKAVHEQLTGHSVASFFPTIEKFAIRHPKQIDRQRKQNEFYDTIN